MHKIPQIHAQSSSSSPTQDDISKKNSARLLPSVDLPQTMSSKPDSLLSTSKENYILSRFFASPKNQKEQETFLDEISELPYLFDENENDRQALLLGYQKVVNKKGFNKKITPFVNCYFPTQVSDISTTKSEKFRIEQLNAFDEILFSMRLERDENAIFASRLFPAKEIPFLSSPNGRKKLTQIIQSLYQHGNQTLAINFRDLLVNLLTRYQIESTKIIEIDTCLDMLSAEKPMADSSKAIEKNKGILNTQDIPTKYLLPTASQFADFLLGISPQDGKYIDEIISQQNFLNNFSTLGLLDENFFPTKVTTDTRSAFLTNPYARSAHRKMTDFMLHRFGLVRQAKKVVFMTHLEESQLSFLNYANSQDRKRLRRIIKSLYLLGNEKLAVNLNQTIIKALKANGISTTKFDLLFADITKIETFFMQGSKAKDGVARKRSYSIANKFDDLFFDKMDEPNAFTQKLMVKLHQYHEKIYQMSQCKNAKQREESYQDLAFDILAAKKSEMQKADNRENKKLVKSAFNITLNNLEEYYKILQSEKIDQNSITIPTRIRTLKRQYEQIGSICKTESIRLINNFFYPKESEKHLPVHKHEKENYTGLSIREIAKQFGSLQGEILDAESWIKTATASNIDVKMLPFADYSHFRSGIIKALNQGKLVKLCVPCDCSRKRRYPVYHLIGSRAQKEINEHAIVVLDYDREKDSFKISLGINDETWYNGFHLFLSNLSLVNKRSKESYFRYKDIKIAKQGHTGDIIDGKKLLNHRFKYEHLTPSSMREHPYLKDFWHQTPKTPTEGFRGKLFVCSPQE